jgi:alkylation response protein AidB-like acyl-CoA dehydrogenase
MQRDIFTSDHEAFRDMVRSFIAAEIAPYHEQWERDGCVSREVWLAAGKAGLLGIDMDERYGGGGNADYRYYLVMNEELARAVALMQNLPRERVAIGATALAGAERAFEDTLAYCQQRQAFGRPIGKFQHNRFVLAEMATELAVARAFTDKAVMEHNAGRLSNEDASMVKWWNTELCHRVVDRCVQLFGGYGYMREYPVARAFLDSRVQTIFGGTTEIQKEIIGRGLGL